jgi:hypothetical protein
LERRNGIDRISPTIAGFRHDALDVATVKLGSSTGVKDAELLHPFEQPIERELFGQSYVSVRGRDQGSGRHRGIEETPPADPLDLGGPALQDRSAHEILPPVFERLAAHRLFVGSLTIS